MKRPLRRRTLEFDVLEGRSLLSAPAVSLTALPLTVSGEPQVVVTPSGFSGKSQVAIDVGLDGSASFAGANDQNQTVATVTLTNNKAAVITLNSFPMPLLPSYYVAASVTDPSGIHITSSTVIMQGPTPDTITLAVPTTLTTVNNAATVVFTAGQGNGYPASATLNIAVNNDGTFQKFASVPVNTSGLATISLGSLSAGTYGVQATAIDQAGNTLVSTTQTVTVAPAATSSSSSDAPLPLSIIPNVGQVDIASGVAAPRIQFVVPVNQANVLLSSNQLNLVTDTINSAGNEQETTQSMLLVGANGNAAGIGQDLQSSYSNIYVDGAAKSEVPNYGQVTFDNVYPGIDLTYQGSTGTLEYAFTIGAGANPKAIVLSFPGDSLSIDKSGDLVLTLPNGSTTTQSAPVAYQTLANGAQEAVKCAFVIKSGEVSLSVGTYNAKLPLVIDPYIFGNIIQGTAGNHVASAIAMTVDSCGDTYLLSNSGEIEFAGSTTSVSISGARNAVVTKLNSSGIPIYTTYLGGQGDTNANAIAVDSQGNVYVTGEVFSTAPYQYQNSATNPSVPADFNQSILGVSANNCAFVASLMSTGVGNQFTIFGGSGTDAAGTAIAIDGYGNVWVAGDALSGGGGPTNFSAGNLGGPFVMGRTVGNPALFLAKFLPDNISNTGFEYVDLFGDHALIKNSNIYAMTIDSDNQIYVVGQSNNPQNMPWVGGLVYTVPLARSAPYIVSNPSSGTALGAGFVLQFQENAGVIGGNVLPEAVITYGTWLGTDQPATSETVATGVFVQDQDAVANEPDSGYVANVYVTGTTNSAGLFTEGTGAVQNFPGGAAAAGGTFIDFATELNIGPSSYLPATVQVAGTYIGTPGGVNMGGGSIFVDTQGNVYVDGTLPAGEASSEFFDTNPLQPYYADTNVNAFLTVLDPTETSVLLGTTLGGNAANEEEAVANQTAPAPAGNFNPPNIPEVPGESLFVDSTGTIYLAGSTNDQSNLQSVIQAAGGSSQIIISPSTSPEGDFLTKIGGVATQTYGPDQFEPNDTSDIPANLDAYTSTTTGGALAYGPFPNLNTYQHSGGPVGDGLNYNALNDYDWYQIIPAQSGPATVTISNINVLAAGPTGAACMNGTLSLYVYQVVNDFLDLLGSSTTVDNSPSQSTTISVPVQFTQGNDILIDVNPYNYTQASYSMSIVL